MAADCLILLHQGTLTPHPSMPILREAVQVTVFGCFVTLGYSPSFSGLQVTCLQSGGEWYLCHPSQGGFGDCPGALLPDLTAPGTIPRGSSIP